MILRGALLCLGLAMGGLTDAATRTAGAVIVWRDWQPALFEQAAREHRLVLLDLEAVWCHWCHVMDQQTYADPQVIDRVSQHYLAVKVDQDARPDLANRYRDYGWPAIVIFAADGTELYKHAGYIPAEDFTKLLGKLAADPRPLQSASSPADTVARPVSHLPADVSAELEAKRIRAYDFAKGGLRSGQKYLDRDSVEYNLVLSAVGDTQARDMARQTLLAGLALLDPVWGGFYQYSTHGDWAHPHYEKIMRVQASYIRLYALAYAQFGERRFLDAAHRTTEYLERFLSDGAGRYYVSQDADLRAGSKADGYFALDDAGRRAMGTPTIDRHIYAQENGWAIEALALLHAVSGEPRYRERALAAAGRMMKERLRQDGLYNHGGQPNGPLYLGDTLAMLRGYLSLYRSTGDVVWLQRSMTGADAMAPHFQDGRGGYATSSADGSDGYRDLAENVQAARFFNLLFHYSGRPQDRERAEHALSFLALPQVALRTVEESGILLADREMGLEPPHLAVVGKTHDEAAERLHALARSFPQSYVRVDRIIQDGRAIPNADVQYPSLTRSAGYVCAEGRCSLPAFTDQAYVARIRELTGLAPALH